MRGFPAPLVKIDLRAKAVALIAMNAVLFLSTSLAVEVYLMGFAIALSVLRSRYNARAALRERKRNHLAYKDNGDQNADNLNLLLLQFDHEYILLFYPIR